MKKRNRKIRSAMAAALAVSMVAAPCSSALAASTSDEITQREIDNAALAREAAGQGMVLLENGAKFMHSFFHLFPPHAAMQFSTAMLLWLLLPSSTIFIPNL